MDSLSGNLCETSGIRDEMLQGNGHIHIGLTNRRSCLSGTWSWDYAIV